MNKLRPRLHHLIMQPTYPLPKLPKPPLIKRKINTIVHTIIRKYQVRLRQCQYPRQPFMKVRTRELPSGMPRLRKPRHCLARQPHIDEFIMPLRIVRDKPCLYILDISTGISDTVPKKNDPVNLLWKRRLGNTLSHTNNPQT